MTLDIIQSYVKPELVVVAIALYFVGVVIKKSETVKDKFIPFILGGLGIVFALVWVLATSTFTGWQSILLAIFTAVIQGILVASLSTYADQLIKQHKKSE